MNTAKVSIALLVAFAASLAAGGAFAAAVDDQLVSKWEAERDETVVQLMATWLRGEAKDEITPLIQEIVRLEALISTCAPQAIGDLYVTGIDDPENLEVFPAQVLTTYLEKNSLSVESRVFFEGKTFSLVNHQRNTGPVRIRGMLAPATVIRGEQKDGA